MTDSARARLDQLERGAYQVSPPRSGGGLLWLLIGSISFNVFIAAFLALQIQDGALWFEVEAPSSTAMTCSQSDSLRDELQKLSAKDDKELIRLLDDESAVANGYKVQELSLALLHSRGYQVEDPLRPLGAWPQPMSSYAWMDDQGKAQRVMLFSSLGPRELQAVRAFLQEAAVPLTAQGILRRLSSGEPIDTLRPALIRTDEWMTFSRLFPDCSETEAIALCQSLGPDGLAMVVDWGRSHADTQELGSLLMTVFTKYPSARLAEYLAAHYADSIVVQAPDETVVTLYSSLPISEAGVRLAMRMVQGQRKLPVWQASQAYLARAAQMPALTSLSREQVLDVLRSLVHPQKTTSPTKEIKIVETPVKPVPATPPKSVTPPKPQTPAAAASARAATRQLKPYRTYVVRKGDTLWSIAKKFNVDVEKLKYLNGLKGTALPPGKTLRIPH